MWETSQDYLSSLRKDSGHKDWGELAWMEYRMLAVTHGFPDTMEDDCLLCALLSPNSHLGLKSLVGH